MAEPHPPAARSTRAGRTRAAGPVPRVALLVGAMLTVVLAGRARNSPASTTVSIAPTSSATRGTGPAARVRPARVLRAAGG